MRQAWVFATVFALAFGAPLNLVEPQNFPDGCHIEYVTVWEEVETEEVNKVVCETEFREECFTELDQVCVNSTEPVCNMVDEMVCVDSNTNKCGLEQVLKNETYTETECKKVYRNVCEYEWIGEGETRKWVPVEDSCVTKPFEECEDVVKYRENFVEKEICRDIPIKDCTNIPKEVCVDPSESQVCEEIPIENCEIVPHEECKQITGTVPKKVSKEVTKIVCNEVQDKNVGDLDLETSIDMADVSENEISDRPDIYEGNYENPDNAENPEIVYDNSNPEVSLENEEEELGVNYTGPQTTIITTESSIKTPEQSMETTEKNTETTEIVTMQNTSTETIVTEEDNSQQTEATQSVKDITTEYIRTETSEAPRKEFDDSRIIFSDEAISNRNKDLATRVFIDDGLLSDKSAGNAEVKPISKVSSGNDRIFFPDQEFNG